MRVHSQYQGHTILVGALATLCEQAQFEHWACDIRQVQALSASKSPLEDFTALDGFAEARCRGHLDDPSPDNIARYLADVAGQPHELTGMLKGYLLNPAAVNALTEEYELFAITRDPLLWDELFEAMRALQATWYAGDLPRPHSKGRPRADRRSMTVASALRQTGVPDLGSYLQLQVHRQNDYPVGPIMAGCHG